LQHRLPERGIPFPKWSGADRPYLIEVPHSLREAAAGWAGMKMDEYG
jgi:hypothetical protein